VITMPSIGKTVSAPSPNSLAVLLSPGNSDGQVLGLDRYGSGQSEIQVSVGGGEKGYQNGGEVVPWQGSRSE